MFLFKILVNYILITQINVIKDKLWIEFWKGGRY